MKLVKPDFLDRPRLSISEDYGPADEFSLSLLEQAKDSRGAVVSSWLR